MQRLHLVMPMGGRGSRFFDDGFVVPKPLIGLKGRPFFYWSVQSVVKFIDVADITFVVLREHVDGFRIDEEIRAYYPDARIVVIPEVLDGAVLTCLEGIRDIADDGPVLFNDCDHMFLCRSFNGFCAAGDFEGTDGALLTFPSDEPKYSFLEYDGKGRVVRTVEKEAVSSHAICGAYYFKDCATFKRASAEYLKQCNYNEFFISGVYNVLAGEGAVIRGFMTDVHIPFGTPEEYYAAEADARLEMVAQP